MINFRASPSVNIFITCKALTAPTGCAFFGQVIAVRLKINVSAVGRAPFSAKFGATKALAVLVAVSLGCSAEVPPWSACSGWVGPLPQTLRRLRPWAPPFGSWCGLFIRLVKKIQKHVVQHIFLFSYSIIICYLCNR